MQCGTMVPAYDQTEMAQCCPDSSLRWPLKTLSLHQSSYKHHVGRFCIEVVTKVSCIMPNMLQDPNEPTFYNTVQEEPFIRCYELSKATGGKTATHLDETSIIPKPGAFSGSSWTIVLPRKCGQGKRQGAGGAWRMCNPAGERRVKTARWLALKPPI